MELDLASLRNTLQARAREWDPQIGEILELVGARTVEYLRSYTSERNQAGRPVHPGGWGDRTFTLRDSYFYEVHREPGSWVLILGNTGAHAHLVEATGKFVVRGITEPGGPVHVALKKAVGDIAPDWRVS